MERLYSLNLSADETLAVEGFLQRYKEPTRELYASDLFIFITWCRSRNLPVLSVKRIHLEQFSRYLMEERGNSAASTDRRLRTVKGFYKLATADEFITKDPSLMLMMPKSQVDPASIEWLDRFEMAALLKAARETSPHHEALVALMGMMGLRVSEACGVRIEDYAEDEIGYRMLRLVGKGGKPASMPVPVPVGTYKRSDVATVRRTVERWI
jgi:site-specific recombinase XerD